MADLEIHEYRDAGFVLWRLNRPEVLNALSAGLLAELESAVAAFGDDPELRAAVLTGTGRAFCAGADLKQMAERGPSGGQGADRRMPPIPSFGLGQCPKPIIAAINGICVAGGMELAMECDIRIAAETAWFALPEVTRGLLAAIAAQHLMRVLPSGEAMYLMLTGARLSVERAHTVGFVQEVVSSDRLVERAADIAAIIAANAPLAVASSKAMLQFWRRFAVTEVERNGQRLWQMVMSSPDAVEGPLAFSERRPPSWS